MRIVRLAVVLVLVTVAGCQFQPGQGVSPTFASQWGCNYTEVMEQADRLAERLPAGKVYVPQVGWTACELLAHNGRPTEIDRQQTAYGRSASWWYSSTTSYETHLVSLTLRSGRWVVDYVGW